MTQVRDRYCFAWFETRTVSGLDRAAMWSRAKWIPGQVIRVAFLEGSQRLKDKVFATAEQWIGAGMANLELQLRNDPNDSDIRIAFQQGMGSWSAIGTTCQLTKKSEATMNFGWLTDASSDEEIAAVVLHEFGHALGLIHEHQNPAGGIRWRKDVIYAELAQPPNRWSKETVDFNLFKPWEVSETNFTKVDPESIMMYPIAARWTEDGFSAGNNTKLSATDRKFIAREYPF
jgi:serralysin